MLDNNEDGYVWQCGINPAYAIWAKWWFTSGMDCGPCLASFCMLLPTTKMGEPGFKRTHGTPSFLSKSSNYSRYIHKIAWNTKIVQPIFGLIWIWLNIGCPVYASGLSSFSMFSSCKWGFSTVLDTWIRFRWFNHHCQLVEPLNPNVDIGEMPSFDA